MVVYSCLLERPPYPTFNSDILPTADFDNGHLQWPSTATLKALLVDHWSYTALHCSLPERRRPFTATFYSNLLQRPSTVTFYSGHMQRPYTAPAVFYSGLLQLPSTAAYSSLLQLPSSTWYSSDLLLRLLQRPSTAAIYSDSIKRPSTVTFYRDIVQRPVYTGLLHRPSQYSNLQQLPSAAALYGSLLQRPSTPSLQLPSTALDLVQWHPTATF
jgi:hypothetical protein